MLRNEDSKMFATVERIEAQYYDTNHEWLRSLLLKKRNEVIAQRVVDCLPQPGTRIRS